MVGLVEEPIHQLGQLAVLGKLATATLDIDVAVWLSGGWAMDFHRGQVTRQHSDIDVIVAAEDQSPFWVALQDAGLAKGQPCRSGVVDSSMSSGGPIEVTYVETTDGHTVTIGVPDWPWPSGSFDCGTVVLEGVAMRPVSVEALLDMKTGYEDHFGEPMRPQDLADVEILRGLLKRSA